MSSIRSELCFSPVTSPSHYVHFFFQYDSVTIKY